MGFSLSWAAVRGKDADAIHKDLGVRPNGDVEEVPESPLVSTALKGGWTVVVANKSDRFLKDPIAKKLSSKGELVACFVDEHVMYSAAMCWKAGRGVWSVCHDADEGADHLETSGSEPPGFAKVHARLERAQKKAGRDADVDHIFDVPIELAKAITGFRHDEGDFKWAVLVKRRR